MTSVKNRSIAGYVGGVFALFLVIAQLLLFPSLTMDGYLFFLFALGVLFAMLFGEMGIIRARAAECSTNSPSLRSVSVRYLSLLLFFALAYAFIMLFPYFWSEKFGVTREFFTALFVTYAVFGWFYIYFTLRRFGSIKYEFGDYAILLLIAYRSIWRSMKENSEPDFRLKNRRVKKVFLVMAVNIFFSTLLVTFLEAQYNSFKEAFLYIVHNGFSETNLFQNYQVVFSSLFYSLFIVDVSIALIGYLIASRWLDNRTKTVDSTLFGWAVALVCYPPFNAFMFDYGSFESYDIITSEWLKMAMMTFVIFLYTIYVWGTVELGFKFSNLTNRGIITTGPYKIVRHPAYISKNLSWWIESSFVLSNFWATLVLFGWNIIYFLRGITEERHLSKDPAYREYMEKTKWRFIPRVF